MVVVLSFEQEATLLQMAADLDLDPSALLGHLVSDRLEQMGNLSLWSE